MNLIVIIGKSSSGKDTLKRFLLEQLVEEKSLDYEELKLTTSRNMRDNETQGNPYNFISKNEFLNKIEKDEFLEYRKYESKFDTWYYGTEKLNENKNYVTVNTLEGLNILKEKLPNANITSFYIDTSDEIREERAKLRGSFNQEEWNRRLITDENDFRNAGKSVNLILNNNRSNIKGLGVTCMLYLSNKEII